MVADWQRYEQPLWPNRYAGSTGPDTVLRVPARHRLSVLLTAPHAVAHWRDGVRKPADVGTGGLARVLADLVGGSALLATGEQTRDGNRDPDGVFKTLLRSQLDDARVRYVIDVHGMSDEHGVDVCLGTGQAPDDATDLLEPILAVLTDAGLRVGLNDPFAAMPDHTVTNTAHRAGRCAVQVEVARRWRAPFTDEAGSAWFAGMLGAAVAAAVTR